MKMWQEENEPLLHVQASKTQISLYISMVLSGPSCGISLEWYDVKYHLSKDYKNLVYIYGPLLWKLFAIRIGT